jgi:hypothetical protein
VRAVAVVVLDEDVEHSRELSLCWPKAGTYFARWSCRHESRSVGRLGDLAEITPRLAIQKPALWKPGGFRASACTGPPSVCQASQLSAGPNSSW